LYDICCASSMPTSSVWAVDQSFPREGLRLTS
jgi:hypothetical protein